MATRKSRMNTESPTPSSGSDTVPTTPVTLSARTRGRKGKSDCSDTPTTAVTEKTEEEEETAKTVQEDDSQMDMSEILNEVRKEVSKDVTTSLRKRRLAALKDDSTPEKPTDKTSPTAVTPEKPRASTEPGTDEKDNASSVFLAAKRPRRSAVDSCVASKQPEKIGKRRNSTGGASATSATSGKIEKPSRLSARIKLRQAKLKRSLLKKPTAISKPLKSVLLSEKLDAKAIKKIKVEKNTDSASDSEIMKMNRRRSDSISKCSDMTDTSSFQENKDPDELASVLDSTQQSIEIKEEMEEIKQAVKDAKSDESVQSNDSVENISVAVVSEAKAKESDTTVSEEKRPVRRLRRNNFSTFPPPKTISTRSRGETPVKNDDNVTQTIGSDDGVEVKELIIKQEAPDSPLHIETAGEKEKDNTDETVIDEKSESLSPVLVSEGVSEISVKQFYGRPDFLENNLGIEEDPKLGEIVQVKEKIKQDEGVAPVTLIDNNNDNKESEVQEAEVAEQETEVIAETPQAICEEEKIETATAEKESDIVENIEDDDEDNSDNNENQNEEVVSKPNLSNTNMIILGSEIEVRPKENKQLTNKKVENENVSDVVLFTITNGVRVNPEKLETVLENQKLKESNDDAQTTITAEIKSQEEAEDEDEFVEEAQLNGEHTTIDNKHSEEVVSVADDDEIETEKVIEMEIDSHEEETEPMKAEATETETETDEITGNTESTDNQSKQVSANQQTPKSETKTKRNKSEATGQVRSPATIQVIKQKETHLKTLGLLTHQAAVAVIIEKEKSRELRKSSASTASSSSSSNGKGKKNAEYTGTLKTVIKLHRGGPNNDRKKGRMPLKMTLHKGKGKNGNGLDRDGSAGNSDEDTYYTIHNEVDIDTNHGGHSRKTHNRSHTTDQPHVDNETSAAKEAVEKALVIPEKAASFRYHPGKLCADQCFYCGGKFGLFDTPRHLGKHNTDERIKEILENTEKLTADSCLCDACYRHVTRRGNATQKKRLSAPATLHETTVNEEISKQKTNSSNSALFQQHTEPIPCKVIDCKELAMHSVRSKWALNTSKSLNKSIHLNFDYNNTQLFLPMCDDHYKLISQLMVCALCNQRLMRKRTNIYYINQDSSKLELLLSNQGIPVLIGSTPVVCKLCRIYVNLLLKPQEGKASFVKDYRRRLLNFHNVELCEDIADEEEHRVENNDDHSQTRRSRSAKRCRKSTPELSTPSSNNSDDVHMRPTRSTSLLRGDHEVTITGENSETVGLRSQRQRLKRLQQEQLLNERQLQDQSNKRMDDGRQQLVNNSNEEISLLRTNPNISMRELFPGEEEMGLNVNIPFSSNNGWRTPEGWTKLQTTIQYDEPTRRLWEELQKPYGNQSSFLRHMILLEKYFRNGDLVLTPNANPNASTYAESAQHRLRSYDNVGANTTSSPLAQLLSNPATTITSIPGAKALTSSVTIHQTNKATVTSAGTSSSRPSSESTSLLKSNRTSSYTITTEPINKDKQNIGNAKRTSDDANKPAANNNVPKTNKSIGMPPELISINNTNDGKHQSPTQQYLNQMKLTLQQQIQQNHQNSLLLLQQHHQQKQQSTSTASASATPASKKANNSSAAQAAAQAATTASKTTANGKQPIRLPDSLTEAELKHVNWSPSLLPISAANQHMGDELYHTTDGRILPALVNVHFSGKPYVMSVQDYNRISIMRRDALIKSKASATTSSKKPTTSTTLPANVSSASIAAAISAITPAATTVEVEKPKLTTTATILNVPNRKVQIPNKILEQNSLIPIGPTKQLSENNADSLLKRKNQTSLLKTNATSANKSNSTAQVSITGTGSRNVNALATALSQSNTVSIISTPSISSILAMGSGTPTSTPPPISNNQPITITSIGSLNDTNSPVTMWQWNETLNKLNGVGITAIDNSTSSILSKIPKSLTVIPQQKRLSSKGDEN